MRNTNRAGVLVAAIALAATVAGCGGDREAAATDTAAGVVDQSPATVATGVAALLSDENVFALLDTAYAAMLQVDRMAQEQATDERVRTLAGEMISQNALGRSGIRSTAERLNVVPALPDRDVIEDHAEVVAALRAKSGVEFDRAYLERVIEAREEMAHEIDEALEGEGVRQQPVKEFLQQIRTNLEADRRRAEQLRSQLGG